MTSTAILVNICVAKLSILLAPEKQLQSLLLRLTIMFREIGYLDTLNFVLLYFQVRILLFDQVVYVLIVDFQV